MLQQQGGEVKWGQLFLGRGKKKSSIKRETSPNVIRMNMSRKMRWTRHVARMGEEEFV
jgi:hypothetical protein